MDNLKSNIQHALETNNLDSMERLAITQKRVLSLLVRFAYDKESLVGWRAIKATGVVSKALLPLEYMFLRETIRKLLWSLTDESGGIGWSAPEIIGEIISADPKRFADIIPILAGAYDCEEDVFRPGVLYAFTLIAPAAPELILPFVGLIQRALRDKQPLVRYYAIQCVRLLKDKMNTDELSQAVSIARGIVNDKSEVWIYNGDSFMGVVLGEEVASLV